MATMAPQVPKRTSRNKGQLYILLSDQIATRKEKTLLSISKPKSDDIVVLKGSLWRLVESDTDVSKNQKRLTLNSVDYDSVILQTSSSEAEVVSQTEFDILIALSSMQERYRVYKDKHWMKEANEMDMGTVVHLLKFADLPEEVPGKIRYRGPLQTLKGTWFGVELSAEFQGKGTSDGSFLKHNYFSCALDTSVFVAINKLRISHRPDEFHEWNFIPTPEEHYENVTQPPLQVNERVVWISDTGPERGTVKWIGHLYDTRDGEWTVGVDFDNPVGTGTGKYKNKQLFRTKHHHASLIPILGLMKESEFGGPNNVPDAPSLPPDPYAAACPPRPDRTHGINKNSPMESNHQNLQKELTQKLSNHQNRFEKSESESSSDVIVTASFDSSFATEESHRGMEISPNDLPPCINDIDYVMEDDKKNNYDEDCIDNIEPPPPLVGCTDDSSTMDLPDLPAYTEHSTVSHNVPPYTAQPTTTATTIHKQDDARAQSPKPPPPILPPRPSIEMLAKKRALSTENGPSYDVKQFQRIKEEAPPPPVLPQPLSEQEVDSDLTIGTLVEVSGIIQNVCPYGVIRWIGFLEDRTRPIAGVEMEEENDAWTDGTFSSCSLFTCPPKKALFVYLSKLQIDQRFQEQPDVARSAYCESDFIIEDSPDIEGTVVLRDDFTAENITEICGIKRGIQGSQNSCYLDTMLFSMFAFTSVFDHILHRPARDSDDEHYTEMQNFLREGVVNPLRKNYFLNSEKILQLRTMLDKFYAVEGIMNGEKDPEEFIECIMGQVMKAEHFLKLSNGQDCHSYQLFMDKVEGIVWPNTQYLLEMSFLESNIKLAEVPQCLILQMPRCGAQYKMFNHIVPSLSIDITDILEFGARECGICGQLATFECKNCYSHFGKEMATISFCEKCSYNLHRHSKRANHNPQPININDKYLTEMSSDQHISRETLDLFAVICIETSHYVAFVKCANGNDSQWVFFNSMADRIGGENGFSLPEIKHCPDIGDWLSNLNSIDNNHSMDDKEFPEHIRRLLCDGYICMYQSKMASMYK